MHGFFMNRLLKADVNDPNHLNERFKKVHDSPIVFAINEIKLRLSAIEEQVSLVVNKRSRRAFEWCCESEAFDPILFYLCLPVSLTWMYHKNRDLKEAESVGLSYDESNSIVALLAALKSRSSLVSSWVIFPDKYKGTIYLSRYVPVDASPQQESESDKKILGEAKAAILCIQNALLNPSIIKMRSALLDIISVIASNNNISLEESHIKTSVDAKF